jgi:hypothetical protein
MPTRKQRRRRQKDRRHEYEYVYVDGEGKELEVDEVEAPTSRRNGKRDDKPKPHAQKGRGSRPVREVPPPSWRRVGKRALIFFPLIFITFSLVNQEQPIAQRLLVTLVYTAFFMPFMYLMDRALYRAYLRRTGQDQKPARSRR